MRRSLVILVLLFGVASQAAVPEESIDSFIDSEMPATGAPGLSYIVVKNGEISAKGVRGVKQIGSSRAVTSDTPFLTGSISKSFTALAVMQFVEAGRVNLDGEVSQYLKKFENHPAGMVTIRQLLSHTSGFSTLQGNTSYLENGGGSDDLERAVDQIARVTPAHTPGSQWAYSNANYQVLGRLIEVISGVEYQACIESNILQPLGMTHSFVSDGEVHATMASGHRPWFGTKRPQPQNMTYRASAPQGGVIASANDLARYLQMMMNGEDDILSAHGKATMMRPASSMSPFYGLGWFVNTEDGSVWHSGSSPGVETLATMLPKERKGVVVLVNAGSGTGFGETMQLRNGITARALGLEYNGESSRWLQKLLFVGLALTPIIFLLSMAWAWRQRAVIRAKSGAFGLFSLWFPLLTTLLAVFIIFGLLPKLFGVSIGTLRRFQPDLVLILTAIAVTGVLWAVFRLGVAYTGKTNSAVSSKR